MRTPVQSANGPAGPPDAVTASPDWVRLIADRLSTADLDYCYRLLRGWLHGVRGQLDDVAAAELAGGLPDPLRTEFCSAWDPASAGGAAAFVARFGRVARVSVAEVRFGAVAVTTAMAELLPAGLLATVFAALPDDVRAVLAPVNRFTSRVASGGSPLRSLRRIA